MPSQTITSKDIYHGLPTFPEHEAKAYTAIVAGATGISGISLIQTLAETPSRWSKIYALSRRVPTTKLPGHVKHIPVDLLGMPEEIAKKLCEHDIKADYAFFAAYIQPPPKPNQGLWSDTEETERVNVALLDSFLKAIKLADSIPKRVLLQTGGKHYGVHLGPTLIPMEESDPRFTNQPNFYFSQEDLLFKWSRENNVLWNVTRPGYILGAAHDAAMNLVYGLALYASVQKELGRKLDFPADAAAWEQCKDLSSAALIAHHAEWTMLSNSTQNEVLNITDDSPFTYGKFWPILASWYGLEYGIPEDDASKYRTFTMPTRPPPRGFGPAGEIRSTWSLEEWANDPETQGAWQRLKQRHNLFAARDPFDNPKDFFGLLDTDMLGPWGRIMPMGKSRKLGWHGYVDSHEAIFKTITELAALKMVPPIALQKLVDVHYHGYEIGTAPKHVVLFYISPFS